MALNTSIVKKEDISFITAKFTSYPDTDPNPDCHEVEGGRGFFSCRIRRE